MAETRDLRRISMLEEVTAERDAALADRMQAVSDTGEPRQERRTDWQPRVRALSPLLVFVIVVIVLLRTA